MLSQKYEEAATESDELRHGSDSVAKNFFENSLNNDYDVESSVPGPNLTALNGTDQHGREGDVAVLLHRASSDDAARRTGGSSDAGKFETSSQW